MTGSTSESTELLAERGTEPAERLLELRGLTKEFDLTSTMFRRVTGRLTAVREVDLELDRGETLALVGESGSGKTTLGRMVVRAIDPTRGEVRLRTGSGWVDLAALRGAELRRTRRNFHMIFQDPYSSLDPRMTVYEAVREPLVHNKVASGQEAKDLVVRALERVGLSAQHLSRYPHAFSGGQRQRIGFARSLVCDPQLIVCDEPVSALDVSVQAQILNLLKDLQASLGLSYLFIAHDLSVVQHLAQRVAVMYAGNVVELAPKDSLFDRPRHPYTEALLSAMPVPEPDRVRERIVLRGEPANPADLPTGCVFHPRCRYATEICRVEIPQRREIAPGHTAACHHAEELQLKGVM
ncbi:ABC transporter ATP-binding protein [Kribbella sp. NPDC004875]|uniref:ABC transporter ATP-binding protein n=1 Tax=Kribbella sp. NPDC004875 TaxID=3364107 RepID=UPI0036C24A6B